MVDTGDGPSSPYDDSLDIEEVCNKEDVITVVSIVFPIFLIIVILLSLVGNILVLSILVINEKLKSLINIFILNLALSDLLFTAGLPFWIHSFIWGWTLGENMCKAAYFVFYAGFYSSIVFLLLMTIQRYIAVVYPLSDWEKGHRFTRIVPVLAWVLSILMTLPAPITSTIELDAEDPSNLFCTFNTTEAYYFVTYEQNTFFLISFSIMSFCYIRIVQTIFKSRSNKRHRTIRLILCIVTVFFVGWAPYNLAIFLQTLTHHQVLFFTNCEVTKSLDYMVHFTEILAFSHCCLNPVFYVFVSEKFRKYLKEFWLKHFF